MKSSPTTVPSQHDLKCWPEMYAEVQCGRKRFEVRNNDRGFSVGDTLHIREWDPGRSEYTGYSFKVNVLYILSSDMFPEALRQGYVVMSISNPFAMEGDDF